MKKMIKTFVLAALAAGATITGSGVAQAQVNGIATTDPTLVIARAQARVNAYNQINATYKAQIDQINQQRVAQQNLLKPYDTNNDNNLTQEEIDAALKSNPNLNSQYEQYSQTMNQLSEPVIKARMYVLEGVFRAYQQTVKSYIQTNKIQFLLSPESLYHADEKANITQKLITELDKAAPSVNATPPAEWRPTQDIANLYQRIQDIDVYTAAVAQQRAQQQQQGQQQQQPQGR